MLETAFRSIIDISKGGKPTIDREELLENFRSFQRAKLGNNQEAYKKLYYRILDHFKRYVETPSFELLVEHFTKEPGCEDVLVVLEQISAEKPRIGGNYKDSLRLIKETQDLESLQEALTEANEIAVKGRKVGKVQMKGVESALDYIANKSRAIRHMSQEFKTEAQILDAKEVDDAKERYEKRVLNPEDHLGIYTGIDQIDDALGGLKHTEFMIVGAFTGQGKSTFSVNMAYRAVYSSWDTALFTLEMTLEEMQEMVYVLHLSNDEVWANTKFARMVGTISYDAIREGTLEPHEKEFYYAALDDFKNNPDYGKLYIFSPEKNATTVEDVSIKCLEVNSELKTTGRKLEFVVVDYIRLLAVDTQSRSREDRDNLNTIIKNLKRLCITFNNGQGLRILSPVQIKREGYVRALSNGGNYLLSDMSDTSEVEKSADVLITLFLDDALRKSKLMKVNCLKARRKEPFTQVEVCANLATKYIYTKTDMKASDLQMSDAGEVNLSGV